MYRTQNNCIFVCFSTTMIHLLFSMSRLTWISKRVAITLITVFSTTPTPIPHTTQIVVTKWLKMKKCITVVFVRTPATIRRRWLRIRSATWLNKSSASIVTPHFRANPASKITYASTRRPNEYTNVTCVRTKRRASICVLCIENGILYRTTSRARIAVIFQRIKA